MLLLISSFAVIVAVLFAVAVAKIVDLYIVFFISALTGQHK